MKDRLLQLITRFGFTATRLADELGVQRSGISHILSGRNQPSYDFMVKLLNRFPEINAEWLLLGKGNMYKPTGNNTEANKMDKDKPSPKLPGADLFTNPSNAPANSNVKPPESGVATFVNSIDRIVILHADQTFSIYTQAGKV